MNINGDCLSYSNNVPSWEIIEVFLLIDSVLGQSLPGMEPLLYIIYIIARHSPAVTSNFLVPRESIMSILLLSTRILCRVSGLCNVEDLAVLMDLFYDQFGKEQTGQIGSGLGQTQSSLRHFVFLQLKFVFISFTKDMIILYSVLSWPGLAWHSLFYNPGCSPCSVRLALSELST